MKYPNLCALWKHYSAVWAPQPVKHNNFGSTKLSGRLFGNRFENSDYLCISVWWN